MCPGGYQYQPIGAEMQGLQAQRVDLTRHDADVGAPVKHAAGNFSIRFFLKVDIYTRVAGKKTRQDFGQKIRHRRGICKHPDVTAQAAAIFLQIGAQLLGLPQHTARVVQKGFAGRTQAHAAGFAVKQWQAGLRFQRLDARTRGGQREMLPGGGARQIAFFGGEDEKTQVSEVKMHDEW